MTITLRIENFDQLPDGGPVQYQASRRSFEIGREQHLDWTLPDPNRVISGRHCEVRYEKGGYWLFDVSRNGTFLNNSGARMKSPYRLQDGDRLQIGHYLISVARAGGAPRDDDEVARRGARRVDSIWDIGGSTPAPVDRRAFMPEAEARPARARFLRAVCRTARHAAAASGRPGISSPTSLAASRGHDRGSPAFKSPFGARRRHAAPAAAAAGRAPEGFVQQAPRCRRGEAPPPQAPRAAAGRDAAGDPACRPRPRRRPR